MHNREQPYRIIHNYQISYQSVSQVMEQHNVLLYFRFYYPRHKDFIVFAISGSRFLTNHVPIFHLVNPTINNRIPPAATYFYC
jgi:hypothetical protein